MCSPPFSTPIIFTSLSEDIAGRYRCADRRKNHQIRQLKGVLPVKRWLCLLVVLCCLAAAPSAAARSYELLDLDISAQVGADAVVRITETLRVRFNGTYSGMYRYFDTSRGIAIKDLFVSERGTDYQQSPGETPGPAGTFFVKEEKEQLLVDWSFSATDEIREFEISYSLHNAILKHNDVAEFYYQFVGTGWELPWQHVRVVLTLPQGAEADQVAAWGYGPQHGKVTVESPSRIIWEVANHPAESFLEGRVVFPNALVPLGTRYTNQNGLDRILREEQVREERQKRAEQRKAFDPFVAAVVLAAAIRGGSAGSSDPSCHQHLAPLPEVTAREGGSVLQGASWTLSPG